MRHLSIVVAKATTTNLKAGRLVSTLVSLRVRCWINLLNNIFSLLLSKFKFVKGGRQPHL